MSYYIKHAWHSGLTCLPTADYVVRRNLWMSLTKMAKLEHPAIVLHGRGSDVQRVWSDAAPADATAVDALSQARAVARAQILATLREEWDARHDLAGHRATLAARRGVPVEAMIEPLYVADAGYSIRRSDLLERYAVAPERERAGAEAAIAVADDAAKMYWMSAPPVDLHLWRSLCEWVEARGGDGITARTPIPVSFYFLLYDGAGDDRIRAVGTMRGGHGKRVLVPGWRDRLAELETLATALECRRSRRA